MTQETTIMTIPPSPSPEMALIVGRLDGRVSDLITSVNQLSYRFDGLHKDLNGMSREISALAVLSTEVSELKDNLRQVKLEIGTLREEKAKSEGVNSTLIFLVKSPLLPYIGMFIAFIYMFFIRNGFNG